MIKLVKVSLVLLCVVIQCSKSVLETTLKFWAKAIDTAPLELKKLTFSEESKKRMQR